MVEGARLYRRKGILIKPFAQTSTLRRLNAVCREIFEGRIKAGYEPVVHYGGSAWDMEIDHEYDPVLLDALFENDVPRLMQDCLGPNAVLFNINAVTSIPPGYVTYWHSDSHARPVHKVFYYPVFDGETEPCLEILPGHIKPLWCNENRFLTNKYSKWLESTFSRKQLITSSNSRFVVLNTYVMHRAVPVLNPRGTFRLMYSFIDWFANADERREVMSLPLTTIRINDEIVQHYQKRLSDSMYQTTSIGTEMVK